MATYGILNQSYLTDIADAIRAKNGAAATYTPGEMPAAIAAITTGSSDSSGTTAASSSSGDVNFIDHDGTVLYSYSWDEIAEMTELPDLPTWTAGTDWGFEIEMTCTGWNYSLENIQAYSGSFLNVGAVYEPSDGKTHLVCFIGEQGDAMIRLTCSTDDAAVIIDWGDGATTETTSASATTYTHEYENEAKGFYDITIKANNGTAEFTAITTSASASSSIVRRGCLGQQGSITDSSINLSSYWGYRAVLYGLFIGGGITAIGSTAFCHCDNLTAVTVPNTVTSLGVYAFHNCHSLTSITLPESLTSLGNHVFYYCYSLTSIALPESLTSLGNYVFYYCYSLTSIALPESLTSLGDYAFYYCYSLASIALPESLTSLGNYVFCYCYSLASIALPESLTSLGNYTFAWCYSLTSITLPESLTSLGNYVFLYCYSLASISIPKNVTSIGINAFYSCCSLTSITLPESLTSIGNSIFYDCYSLASISIPESVTSIGGSVFYNCYSLSSISIPEGVTSIDTYTFYNCYSLASISIPESVTSIRNSAFYGCVSLYGLDGLILSSTATNTFGFCYRLTELTNVVSISVSVDFSYSPLSYDSVINVFNALDEDNTGTITLSSDSYSLLSEDDLAIATDKGWTVTT